MEVTTADAANTGILTGFFCEEYNAAGPVPKFKKGGDYGLLV
jgi:hypothetical protein